MPNIVFFRATRAVFIVALSLFLFSACGGSSGGGCTSNCGAEFASGGASVQEYYRLFARGQAGEDYAARGGYDWPVPLTDGKPFSAGVFQAVRYGRLPQQ